jgi:hypothetical protein
VRAKRDIDQTKKQHDQEEESEYSPPAVVSRVICDGRESVMLPEPRDLAIILEVKKELSGIPTLPAVIGIDIAPGDVKIPTEALRAAKWHNPLLGYVR